MGARRFCAIQDVTKDALQLLEESAEGPVDQNWEVPTTSWSDAEDDEAADEPIQMDTVPATTSSQCPSLVQEQQGSTEDDVNSAVTDTIEKEIVS